MKKRLLSLMMVLLLVLTVLPVAYAEEHIHADEDHDHYCDTCVMYYMNKELDVNHNHVCDICGEAIWGLKYEEEKDSYVCEICGAMETYVGADFTELSYRLNGEEILASGKVLISARKSVGGEYVPVESGTVSLVWEGGLTHENLPLTDGQVVVPFTDLPIDKVNGTMTYTPAPDVDDLPAENGLVLEYNACRVRVDGPVDVLINGMPTNRMYWPVRK